MSDVGEEKDIPCWFNARPVDRATIFNLVEISENTDCAPMEGQVIVDGERMVIIVEIQLGASTLRAVKAIEARMPQV